MHTPGGYMGRDLKQTICSPPEILEPVYQVFGGPADLDPFDDAKSIVRARRKIRWPKRCGFASRWHGKVYANPPFARLGEALLKAMLSVYGEGGADEVILLCPVRSHRRYWWPFWLAQSACYLKAFAFHGWDEQFPLPCVLVYFGPRAGVFERFVAHLGRVVPLTPWSWRPIMRAMETPKDIALEYEDRSKRVLIDVVRAHPELSLQAISDKLGLEEDESERLFSTPLGELIAIPEVPMAAQAKVNGANGVHRNGTRAAAKPAVRKKKTPPRAPKGSGAERVDAFVGKKAKGTKFTTAELMDATQLTRKTVLRLIEARKDVRKSGRGRSAYLEKTK